MTDDRARPRLETRPESRSDERTLTGVVLRAHPRIRRMLAEASSAAPTFGHPRRLFALTDTFLTTLSRHLNAVEDVVYPAARRHLDDGRQLVTTQVRDVKALERMMRMVEGSLNGDVFERAVPLAARWDEMAEVLDRHSASEEELVTRLDEALPDDRRDALADAYESAVRRAPTRPHPYSPHSPVFGGLAHRLWSLADRAMDEMDVRVIPHDSPRQRRGRASVSQYVLGTPTFDVDPPDAPEQSARE